MATAGVSSRQLQAGIGLAYCGTSLYKSNLSRSRAARVAEVAESEQLAQLAASDVYWDRIASIESDGETDVYDLTVDGLHNFVAENIVVHNSIEQDSDVVGFLYRDEYYTKEESEEPGVAELIIAKHRNGPVRTIKMAFISHYPKFADMARGERPVEQRSGEGPPLNVGDEMAAGGEGPSTNGENDFGADDLDASDGEF